MLKIDTSLRALLEPGQRSPIDLLKNLQIGQRVTARVVDTPRPDVARLQIGAQQMLAKVPAGMPLARTFEVEVSRLKPLPELRMTQPPPPASPQAPRERLLAQSLPRQQPINQVQRALADALGRLPAEPGGRAATADTASAAANPSTPQARAAVELLARLTTAGSAGTAGRTGGEATAAPAGSPLAAAGKPPTELLARVAQQASGTPLGRLAGELLGRLNAAGPAAGQAAAAAAAAGAAASQPAAAGAAGKLSGEAWLNLIAQLRASAAPAAAPGSAVLRALATDPQVQQLFQRLLGGIRPTAPIPVNELRQSVEGSGLLLEQQLALGRIPNQDRKLDLLRLLHLVRSRAAATGGGQADGMSRPGGPAGVAVERLLQTLESGVARIQTQQAHSLPQPAENRQVWQFDLPVHWQDRREQVELQVTRDDSRRNSGQEGSPWEVVLKFECAGLGPVEARVQLAGDRVSSTFWCRQSTADAKISEHLPDLDLALRRAGLEVGRLASCHGAPPQPVAPETDTAPRRLLDLRA